MGYAFSVYGVDLAKLKAVWGSHNARLAKAIKTKSADRFTHNTEWFATYIANGAPTLARALDEIVAGKPTQKKHGFQYGYAVEQLCLHLGKRVDDGDLRTADALAPLLAKAKQPKLDTLLGTGVLPFAIPRAADFPTIGTLDAKRLVRLGKALDAIAPRVPTDEGPNDYGIAWVFGEVRGWLARATKAKRQIVWFVY